MYEIFLFSGGVYRFDELKEAVEDVGGVVFKKNLFHVGRGTYFMADEVQAMFIIPEEEEDTIKSFAEKLKGRLEKLDVEDIKRMDLLTYVSVCDALIKSGKWMSRDEIKDRIECPCPAQLCEIQEMDFCIHDQLDESLGKFCKKNVLKSKKKIITQYYLIEED
ncbi:MAG TPA: methyl-coenzyme M reductase family protein [Methanobacterium sp.]|jgi:hypothetical protein|nr:MAG: hypothetical protein FGO69_05205 [Methanobacterium sp.]HOI71203.1 methyl-coenzyme M reductase family protein [Methanobacterium sp.]HPX77813.1 methyl-coenzyme M reductase family protein [Methanobacterium sp.]